MLCPFGGTYTVTFTVSDENGQASSSATVAVANVPPVLTVAADQAAVEGAAHDFNLGSFTDPGSADGPWTVDVNWGDKSPDTVFQASAPGALGAQTHEYAAYGAYDVTVTVTDQDGGSDTRTYKANVADAPLHATGQPLTETAATAFSDDDPAGSAALYDATIDWGDGSTSTASAADGSLFAVSGGFASAAGTPTPPPGPIPLASPSATPAAPTVSSSMLSRSLRRCRH